MQIERKNVTNQIIAYLRQNIEAGKWKEGERLPSEHQMTEDLGVSRASVRTAIQYLAGIGAVESVHGKGTYLVNADTSLWGAKQDTVTERDCRDLARVLEFCQIVEPEACYLAVLRDDGALVTQLEGLLAELKQSVGEEASFSQADTRFHEAVCRASGNPVLYKSMARIFREMRMYREEPDDPFTYQDTIRYHTMILQAIRARDEILARELMYEHIQRRISRI